MQAFLDGMQKWFDDLKTKYTETSQASYLTGVALVLTKAKELYGSRVGMRLDNSLVRPGESYVRDGSAADEFTRITCKFLSLDQKQLYSIGKDYSTCTSSPGATVTITRSPDEKATSFNGKLLEYVEAECAKHTDTWALSYVAGMKDAMDAARRLAAEKSHPVASTTMKFVKVQDVPVGERFRYAGTEYMRVESSGHLDYSHVWAIRDKTAVCKFMPTTEVAHLHQQSSAA